MAKERGVLGRGLASILGNRDTNPTTKSDLIDTKKSSGFISNIHSLSGCRFNS